MGKSLTNKSYTLLILGLGVLLSATLSCSQKADEDILAEIDGLSVTTTHFENAFKEYYYRTGQVLGQDQRTKEAVLNSTFSTYVLATYAKESGLDETSEALYKKGAIERRVLTEEYLNSEILKDVTVTDQEVRSFFVRFNSQLRASHIYARTEEEINTLYQRLQDGESFEDLAEEVFQNPYLAQNGGDIGRFSTDELDIAFENAAYELNIGEISEPVRTAQGYSIIKLTEKVSKPIILESEFATARQNVRSYVYSKKDELAQREHMYNFIDHLMIDETVLNEVLDVVEAQYPAMLQKESEFISRMSGIDNVLAQFEDFEYSTDQLLQEYLVSEPEVISTLTDEASFRDFVKATAYRAYMVMKAKEAGLDQQKLVQESMEETWLTYLSVEADDHLRNSIVNTPAELFYFFEENQNEFYHPAEINVQRLVVKTEDDANYMLQLLDLGQSFEELINEYTINNEDLFTGGVLGYQSVKDMGSLANKLTGLEKDEISDVIQYQNNEYHIYKMLGKKDAEPMIFSEAEEQVNYLVTQQKLRDLRSQTIENVKERYNAMVDLEKLKELTIQI